MTVGLIDLGMGNLFSVEKALVHLGHRVFRMPSPDGHKRCDLLLLPGQGHFGEAMDQLKQSGWLPPLLDWLHADRPYLGICLGMQLLFRYSKEGSCEGLGVLDGTISPFTGNLKVPHMGWNAVVFKDGRFTSFSDRYFYFVHSYYAPVIEQTIGFSEYGVTFSAAVQKGHCFGVQFHPEKSQKVGLELLEMVLRSFANAAYTES